MCWLDAEDNSKQLILRSGAKVTRLGKRRNSVVKAMLASRRARGAPKK
jgi:hypothetical protein